MQKVQQVSVLWALRGPRAVEKKHSISGAALFAQGLFCCGSLGVGRSPSGLGANFALWSYRSLDPVRPCACLTEPASNKVIQLSVVSADTSVD